MTRRSIAAGALIFVLGLAQPGWADELEEWLQKALQQSIGSEVAGDDKEGIADCLAVAMVSGIPGGDQARIVSALKSRKLDRSTNDLFERYLGMSPLDGPVMPPDPTDPSTFQGGKLHYKSGREVQPIDPAQATTIKAVTAARCADLVRRYPRAFKL
jgi:hypothetical protein